MYHPHLKTKNDQFWPISQKTLILGAQLSSRCLWMLTCPKHHEPSLDIWKTNRFDTLVILFWRHILLVVWKCLILCQTIVICRECWFSSFIRRKRRLKRIESSKKFTEMLLLVKQRAVIGSVASKTVISMLTTVRAKEGQKPSKTLMLFIMSCWNRTKSPLGNGIESDSTAWQRSASRCETR